MIYLFAKRQKRFIFDTESCTFAELPKEHWQVLSTHSGNGNILNDAQIKQAISSSGCDFGSDLRQLFEMRYLGVQNDTVSHSQDVPVTSPRFRTILLFVTDDCNLNCVYCYERETGSARKRKNGPIDVAVAKQTCDYLISNFTGDDPVKICFFGGEPLLYMPVLQEVVSHLKTQSHQWGKKISYSLTTNGTLLTEEIVDFLNEENFGVVLSLDGPDGIQNLQRPKKVAADTTSNLEANLQMVLQKMPPCSVIVRSTFTSASINMLPAILEYFVELGAQNISIEPAVLPASHAYAVNDIKTVVEAFDLLADKYLELKKDNPVLKIFIFEKLMNRIANPVRLERQCGLGTGVIAVGADGDFYPCQRLTGYTDLSLGNVKSGLVNSGLLNELAKTSVHTKEQCQSCWAKYMCGGGCIAVSYELFGSLLKNDELSCDMMKELIHLAAWISSEELAYSEVVKQ